MHLSHAHFGLGVYIRCTLSAQVLRVLRVCHVSKICAALGIKARLRTNGLDLRLRFGLLGLDLGLLKLLLLLEREAGHVTLIRSHSCACKSAHVCPWPMPSRRKALGRIRQKLAHKP